MRSENTDLVALGVSLQTVVCLAFREDLTYKVYKVYNAK